MAPATASQPSTFPTSAHGAQQDEVGVPKTNVSGALTQNGGAATHALTIGEMPAHDHDISHTHDVSAPSGIGILGPGGLLGQYGPVTTSAASPSVSGSTGGGTAHSILDPYFAISFIIYSGN